MQINDSRVKVVISNEKIDLRDLKGEKEGDYFLEKIIILRDCGKKEDENDQLEKILKLYWREFICDEVTFEFYKSQFDVDFPLSN